MKINGNHEKITDFKYEDFILSDYDPHPAIRAPISV
jgi:thymidylate synthase